MKKIALTIIVAGLMTGCASTSSSISAIPVSSHEFSHLSCQQTREALTVERANLSTLSASQDKVATGDKWGVFLLGLPIGSAIGDDVEGDVALAKGNTAALKRAVQINCAE